jgi:phage host-nuclease inhibitor protein Gam
MMPQPETAADILAEAEFDAPAPDVPEGFSVRTQDAAAWLVRKIAEARAYAKRVKAWADKEIERAEKEEQFFSERFGAELEGWTRKELGDKPKRKSIDLPAGRVGFRQLPAKLVVEDQEAAVAWALENLDNAVRVRTTVIHEEIEKHVEATGEVPPGARFEDAKESFYVRT